jgi:hypothetical protein
MNELTLGQKQRLFTQLVAKLIEHAYAQGYELTFAEAYRTPEQARWNAEQAGTGISHSLHTSRLAIDLNLFKDGKFLTTSDDHRPLGAFWKSLHPECAWGGDFRPRPDGNHYSLSHNGIR